VITIDANAHSIGISAVDLSGGILLGAELNAQMKHQTARDTTEGGPNPLGSGAQ
jgi:hypothetical protein